MLKMQLPQSETSMTANCNPAGYAPMRPVKRCQILAKKGFLTARRVRSNVVVLIHSPEFQLGVLMHMGESMTASTQLAAANDSDFTEAAVPMILKEFESLGVRRDELYVCAIGGSGAIAGQADLDAAVRRALAEWGLTLTASDLGGNQVRSVWMEVGSGRLIIRSETDIRHVGAEVDQKIGAAS